MSCVKNMSYKELSVFENTLHCDRAKASLTWTPECLISNRNLAPTESVLCGLFVCFGSLYFQTFVRLRNVPDPKRAKKVETTQRALDVRIHTHHTIMCVSNVDEAHQLKYLQFRKPTTAHALATLAWRGEIFSGYRSAFADLMMSPQLAAA